MYDGMGSINSLGRVEVKDIKSLSWLKAAVSSSVEYEALKMMFGLAWGSAHCRMANEIILETTRSIV